MINDRTFNKLIDLVSFILVKEHEGLTYDELCEKIRFLNDCFYEEYHDFIICYDIWWDEIGISPSDEEVLLYLKKLVERSSEISKHRKRIFEERFSMYDGKIHDWNTYGEFNSAEIELIDRRLYLIKGDENGKNN
jgi:hypothetical protein